MRIVPTKLEGVHVIETNFITDQRGAFARLFCERELIEVVGTHHAVQLNYSCTMIVGTVRGLHYQKPPHAEMKLVRCMKGRVWDVAVDLRAGSASFLKWHAEELSPDNARMLVIPEGCAHGYQVLEHTSELLYFHTAFYEPGSESGVHCQDSRLAINWPLPVGNLSQRDSHLASLTPEFKGIVL